MPVRARGKLKTTVAHEPISFVCDGPVLESFLFDNSPVAIIQGPIGSGKTRAAVMRMVRHCSEQPRQRDGKRRSRWLVVRQTYPELKTTTIKAFIEQFPEGTEREGGFGGMTWSPPFTYHFSAGDVEAEFIFLALENEDDLKKLRSLECTGIYVNELQYIDLSTFSEGDSRVGRFPSVKDGGCAWTGVIADMNAPEALHWVPIMFGLVPAPDYFTPDDLKAHRRPETWRLFLQPPALIEVLDDDGEVVEYKVNPKAENRNNLREDYYPRKLNGTTKAWIDANLLNKPAALIKGRPVHQGYRREKHVAKTKLTFEPDLDLYGGFDFGVTPAAVFGQQVAERRWKILLEMYAEDLAADAFAPIVRQTLIQKFPGLDMTRLKLFGDPGGDIRDQGFGVTAFAVFRKHHLILTRAPGHNRLPARKECVDSVLKDFPGGYPRILFDPQTRMLQMGLQGGYQFKDVHSPTGVYKSDQIVKNQYSHVVEAFQNLLLGGGEGAAVLFGENRAQPVNTQKHARVFDRGPRRFGGRR